MNTKNFIKITIIAAFMALVMLAVFVLPRLGFPIKVYAQTAVAQGNLQVETNTFLDMRSSLKQGADSSQFENWDFQHNEDNFASPITAEELGKLKDQRYDKSFAEESQAIQLNKNELKEIVGPKISETSTLTVFTYGQKASLSHWSNDGWRNGHYGDFAYDEDSMIEFLRRSSNADVYVARTKAIDVSDGDNSSFKVNIDKDNSNVHLALYKLEANDISYKKIPPHSIIGNNFVTKIEDMTKHNIILFDSNNSEQYHNFVYNELNIILTQISYDYLVTIGQVPKISMISHSTGGVWNMMWANKHPLNVDKLFALAAPFNGTALGHCLYFEYEQIANGAIPALGNAMLSMRSAVVNPSGLDNVDEAKYTKLHEDWQKAVSINKDLYCFSFTGPTSLDLVVSDLVELATEKLVENFTAIGATLIILLGVIVGAIIIEVVALMVAVIAVSVIFATVKLLTGPFPIVGLIAMFAEILAVKLLVDKINELIDSYGNIVRYIIDSIYTDKNGALTLYDDFTVDSNSALGQVNGSVDGPSFKIAHKYDNFERQEKTFRPDNCDVKKLNLDTFAVGHNLEAQDADLISDIEGNITMDKPETRYIYKVLADNTIQIDGIKDGFYNENIVIPEYIDGLPVTQIAEDAFRTKTEIISVEMGENIINIQDSAFETTSLEKVDLNDGLLKIGARAFQNTALTTIEIPNTTKEIWSHAFANSTHLGEIYIRTDNANPDSVPALHFVGAGILDGTSLEKDENNKINIVLGQVLIKYKSEDTAYSLTKNSNIKYFAQKCFEGSILTKLDVSNFEFEDNRVPDYFLYGASNLTELLLPKGIKLIGDSAFEGTTSLKEFTIFSTIESIGSLAFANSGITNLVVETAFPPAISTSDTFDGVSNLVIWVKNYAIKEFEQYWGAQFTYKSKKLTIEFHDSGVLKFSEEADCYGYMNNYEWMIEGMYTREGYYFEGWFDASGKRYFVGSLLEFELEKLELEASWELVNYNIWYEQYGGISDNTDSMNITNVVALSDSRKTGYVFEGWYDNPDFIGERVTILSEISKDTKLYAKFTPIEIIVNYDTTGIDVERSNNTVSFGTRFFAPIPQKTGHAFAGWYTIEGVRITGINGVSLNYSKFLNEITLYSRWTAKSFILEFDDGMNSLVLGDSGLTTEAGSILAGQKIDVNSVEFERLFHRAGYVFEYFADANGNRIDFTNGVPDLGKNFSKFIISPVLTVEEYTFILYDHNNNFYNTVIVNYDEMYDFTTTRVGYEFAGWADKNGNIVFDFMTGTIVTDFTPGVDSNGSVELCAVWTPFKGNISFDSDGGTKVTLGSDYQVVYDKLLPDIEAPTRTGYTFCGFKDKFGTQYINNEGKGSKQWDKTESFATLIAQWEANIYNLEFKSKNHNGDTESYTFSADKLFEFPIAKYEKAGYTFAGWYDAESGGTNLKSTSDIYQDLVLYGQWVENSYALTSKIDITLSTDNRAINLGNTKNTTVGYHVITLSSDVNKLFLYGNATKRIAFVGGSSDLNIYLKDASFTSPNGYNAIKATDVLTIHAISKSKILGSDGIIGGVGSQGNHNTYHNSPSNEKNKAGNGYAGCVGGKGSDGNDALLAKTVNIALEGKLVVKGGRGADGGTGGRGGNGAYGSDGQQGGGKDHGVSGGNGGAGATGGVGGKGGFAVNAENFSNNNSNATFHGGDGGNGGNGGRGGDGGRGGKGANNKFLTNDAGDGGSGGNGGKGGKGASFGKGSPAISLNYSGDSYCSGGNGTNGNGGDGGNGGNGGNGGDGPIGGEGGGAGIVGFGGSGNVDGKFGLWGIVGEHG